DAGEPCQRRLPLEPVQGLGQQLRRGLLVDDVEAAAMHHPDVALFVQGVIEPGEEIRLADPHDPGEDVEPAHAQVEPLRHDVRQASIVYPARSAGSSETPRQTGHRSAVVPLIPRCARDKLRAVRAIERLLDQLNRAYGGEAWHGPALRELLEDVTEEEATAHPIAGVHSIIELVAHIGVTMDLVSTRLAGTPRELTKIG